MRKILILLIAILNMAITLQAYAQSAELTASGGAFEGYSSSSSNIVLSSYGARSMTSGGAVFGQNSQTNLSASELIHRLRQDAQNGNLSQEDEQVILIILAHAMSMDDSSYSSRESMLREVNSTINEYGEIAQRIRQRLDADSSRESMLREVNSTINEYGEIAQRIRQRLDADSSRESMLREVNSAINEYGEIAQRIRQRLDAGESLDVILLGGTSGLLGGYLECRSPCAIPTDLLGNVALNDPAYYLDTWAVPPWLTPYDIGPSQAAAGLSQFDARSWISQMPNGAGYSTTTGFPHPYSGLYGPLVSDSYSNTDITFDPLGRLGLPTAGAPVVASLFDGLRGSPIAEAVANGANLSFAQTAALVQAGILPLHFLITWGANSSDLDLHLTGPLGNSRFHIYYAARGSLTQQPNARLIDDCVSASCGEVIRVEGLNSGGVYRASVYNYGDQSFSSTNLSTSSNVRLQVVRGGTVRAISGATDNGSTVVGGEVLFSGSPTAGQAGNTWRAVEVNPNTGDVTFVNEITNSTNSASVR